MSTPNLGDLLAHLARLQLRPLELYRVEARGVPNEERVYLKANQRVALRDYLLLVGVHLPDNTTFPHPNQVLWLGNDTLEAGTWLIVYTGSGERIVTFLRETHEPALVLYWGRPITLFNDNRLVPMLLRFDHAAVQIGPPGP